MTLRTFFHNECSAEQQVLGVSGQLTELRAEQTYPAIDKPRDGLAGFGEHAPVRGIARPLEGEHEVIRRLVMQ